MRAFGIFLGYPPDVPIRKEGLGRLLAFILRGALAAQDVQISIAAPYWYRKEIDGLLDDHDIDKRRIKFLFTAGTPYALSLRKLFEALTPRRLGGRLAYRLYKKAKSYLWRFVVGAGSSSTAAELLPYVIVFFDCPAAARTHRANRRVCCHLAQNLAGNHQAFLSGRRQVWDDL